ncbi:hypothetical protein PLESTF_000085800 [Pleodorina starrii]|nr:hypothetical protein PLESTF_000085800 [Pleodorina starrii]
MPPFQLHAPRPAWTKAGASDVRVAKASANVQAAAVSRGGVSPPQPRSGLSVGNPAPPLYGGNVTPALAPEEELSPAACDATAAAVLQAAAASAAAAAGNHCNSSGGWPRSGRPGCGGGAAAAAAFGDWPLVNGGTHHDHHQHQQQRHGLHHQHERQRRQQQQQQWQQQQRHGEQHVLAELRVPEPLGIHLGSRALLAHAAAAFPAAAPAPDPAAATQPPVLLVGTRTAAAGGGSRGCSSSSSSSDGAGGRGGGGQHWQERQRPLHPDSQRQQLAAPGAADLAHGGVAWPVGGSVSRHGGVGGRQAVVAADVLGQRHGEGAHRPPAARDALTGPPPAPLPLSVDDLGREGLQGAVDAAATATANASIAGHRRGPPQPAWELFRPPPTAAAATSTSSRGLLEPPPRQRNQPTPHGRHPAAPPPPVWPPPPPPLSLAAGAIAAGAEAATAHSSHAFGQASSNLQGSALSPPAAAAVGGGGGGAPATTRLGGAALSAAIRAATSLDELADLYDTQRDGFRSGHVSAALGRLPHAAGLSRVTSKPRLAAARHEGLLQQLLARFEVHRAAGEYGTRDLSACAWVLGTLGRRERAGMVADLSGHMLALRRRHLTAAAAAPPPPGRASDCTPLDVSNMALGMAKAGVTSPDLWEQLAEAATARLGEFGSQETANLAWSFAQAHREFCRREAAAPAAPAGAAGGDAPPEATSEDESELWSGFAAWPAGCGGAAAPAAPRALHTAWRRWAAGFVEDVLAPRARQMLSLRLFTPQQAANAAWALAALGHADARTLAAVAAAAEAAAAEAVAAVTPRPRRAPPLTPQGVCMLVWAMATMVTTRRLGAASLGNSSRASDDSNINNTCGAGSSSNSSSSSGSETSVRQDSSPSGSTPSTSSSIRDTNRASGDQHSSSSNSASSGDSASSNSTVREDCSPPPPPEPPPPPRPQPAASSRPAVNPGALLALARVASSRIDRFTAQGLSNLLWGLGVLGFRSPREVLELATREALLRLPELRPLGLSTLLEDWARARRYHPALFAAAAPLAAAQLHGGGGADAWRPRTLVRLLRAYGAVGHADRRLFWAAAAALAPDGGRGGGGVGLGLREGGGGGAAAAAAAPMDELSPAELYQLACAYGRVGVHAPQLMDELLARLAPLLTAAAAAPPPRAAGRLLCTLAVLGHRPAGAAAVAAFRSLRRSVLIGLSHMTSRHALAAVWALARLRSAGAPAVLQMARLLARRAAPSAAGLGAGLTAVARTPSVWDSPAALARFVWVLGRGAAAAAADAERLRAAATIEAGKTVARSGAGAAARGVGAAAAAEVKAADGVLMELAGGLVAVAEALLDRPGADDLPGEVLVALAEALAELLALAPEGAGDASHVAAMRLYDMSYSCFLAVAELALRSGAAGAGTGAGAAPPPHGPLAARDLTAFVHAMYDSGVVARQPAMRAAAARQVLYRLQAAAAPPPPPPGSAPGPRGWASHSRQPPWQQQRRPLPPPHHQHQHDTRRSHHQRPPRLSADDLARLLAAAARLGLFEHPLAQPLLRDAARALVRSVAAPAATTTIATASASGAAAALACSGGASAVEPTIAASGATQHAGARGPVGAAARGTSTGAEPAAAASRSPLGLAALQELLRYCWPGDDAEGEGEGEAERSGCSTEGEGGDRSSSSRPPGGRPPGAGDGGAAAAAAAAASDGRALRRALHGWAARQALPVLPWLHAGLRVQVLAAVGAA